MESRIHTAVNLYVLCTLGVFLTVAPWSAVWDGATAVASASGWGAWLRSGWVRGLVTGIGGLNLAAAAREIRSLWTSYKDDPGPGRQG